MSWSGNAIVLETKNFGENGCLVGVISDEHGLHKGLLKNNAKKKINIGDFVLAKWTARLDGQLGVWSFEVEKSCTSYIMHDRLRLKCLIVVCKILSEVLTERTPCADVYKKFYNFLNDVCGNTINYVFKYLFFELFLLPRAGFVLNFEDIKMATEEDPLFFVSPRTGKVVTKETGAPYKEKLLIFPQFLINELTDASIKEIHRHEIKIAFDLTTYFLLKNFDKLRNNEIFMSMRNGLIKEICEEL